MGELGRFLEVVYGPGEPFKTARATIRLWADRDLARAATGGGRTQMGRRRADAQLTPEVSESRLSVWISRPGRFRVEERGADGTELKVANGDRWWHRDRQGHVEAGEPGERPGRRRLLTVPLTDLERHFDHASLRHYFAGLSLEERGVTRAAGRDCLAIRAVPRPHELIWSHWLPSGADEYEIRADAERGVLLYIAGFFGGRVFEVYEVLDVAFDEPLADDLFLYEPAPGDQVRPPDVIVDHMTLRDAAAKVPFTVLVPSRLPPGAGPRAPDVMHHPARLGGHSESVVLMYMGDDHFWINQSATPDSEASGLEWERIDYGDKRMAISDPGIAEGMRVVALKQQGTHVTVWTELPREQALDLAGSLTPFGEAE